jgi:hypothetical protein
MISSPSSGYSVADSLVAELPKQTHLQGGVTKDAATDNYFPYAFPLHQPDHLSMLR